MKSFIQKNKQLLGMLAAIVILFAVLSFTVKDFLSLTNIVNILTQVAPIAIMAYGVTFVLVTGGMDISGPSVMAASSVVGVFVMINTGNYVLGAIVLLAGGALLGFINGFAVAKFKMVPMVVTLSMMTIATGIATVIGMGDGGRGLPLLQSVYSEIFNKYTIIGMLVVITVVLEFLLTGTKFGRKVYCIGNNINTARISGINATSVILIAYVISGLCASVAGLINVSILSTARASMGPQSQILDILSAAVIGGVSVNGGKGRVRDAFLGALLIIGVNNVINMLGITDYYATLIKGSIIVIAMGVTAFRTNILSKKLA